MANEPQKWAGLLGSGADVNTIPEETPAGTGAASMKSIFPPITQVPLNAGGIAPDRADFNGLFKLLGDNIYYQQQGGVYSYSADIDYAKGSLVKYNDIVYIAIQPNGPTSIVVSPDNVDYWKEIVLTNWSGDIGKALNAEYKSTDLRYSRGFFMGFDTANMGRSGGVLDWDAVRQSTSVDKYSNLLFFANTNSSNKTRLGCSKWSAQEYEREFVGVTPYGIDFPHQCISVYRPSEKDNILIGAMHCEYTAAGATDYTQCNIFNLWEINVSGSSITYQLNKSVKLLTPELYDNTKSVQATISYDNKHLIIVYTDLDQNNHFAVWDMQTVANAVQGQDLSNNKLYDFVSPYGATSWHGQGIYSDGKYIYCLYGTGSTGIHVLSFDGKDVSSSFYVKYSLDKESFPQIEGEYPQSVTPESEGIFWADYNGITKMMVCICQKATYSNSYLARYICTFDLTDGDIDTSAYTPHRGATVGITDADDVLGDNVLLYSGVANLPVAHTGYLQSFYYPVENQYCRQFYSGLGSYVNHLYTRLVDPNGTGTTDWRKFVTTDRTDNVISVLSDTLSPQSASTSMSMIFKYQNRFEATKGDTYGFMSRYRKNDVAGSGNVQSNWGWGSVEDGNAPDGIFSMAVYQNNSEVNSARFIFTKDNVASLGDSSHKWASVYATEIHGGANSIDCAVDSRGNGYIRYSNGLQICYGSANCSQGGESNNLPMPFNDSSYTLTATYTGTINNVSISVARTANNTFTLYQSYSADVLTADYIAIGLWK